MPTNKKPYILLILFLCAIGVISAQNGVNSPYTRYGFGQLADQSMGANKAMGNVGYALRNRSYINLMNPAAISSVDSLTFMMDAGFTLQNTNFEENGEKMNTKNASFDYLALQFRLRKNLGISIGMLPYSNVGYSFGTSKNYTYDDNAGDFTAYHLFNGDGGLHQVFAGTGYQIKNNFSAGLLFSYLYGDIAHTVSNTYSDSNIRSRTRYYKTSVSSYKLDLGLQYTYSFDENNLLTLGAVYSFGHKLGADAEIIDQTLSGSTVQSSDTAIYANAFKLPHAFGIGLAYQLNNRWTFALDYTLQKWGGATFFNDQKGSDRSKISLGVEYFENEATTRNLFKRIRYRAGAYYSDPYTLIGDKKGSREYGVSAGVAIPIVNKINNRSFINISGQYVNVKPRFDGLIEESYLRLNIGISFNEIWFMKRKVN